MPEQGDFADLVNVSNLRTWLAPRLGFDAGDLTVRRVAAGHSNEMFELHAGGNRWMLRRPPRVVIESTASNMAREFRLLRALDRTTVPHAKPQVLCEDLDVIGAPFHVTDWIDGSNGQFATEEWYEHSEATRRDLAHEMVDTLAHIALLDWRAIGLEGFGKPEGFLDRQVDRWLSQLSRYRTRPIAQLDDVAEWLAGHRPSEASTGLIHGDYTPANLMFDHGTARIAAVIDWEVATIGDPMLDLGWFLSTWEQAGDDTTGRLPGLRPSELGGMPIRRQLAERYLGRTGRSIHDVNYFQVLALFKLSCILEGSYYRYVNGLSSDPVHRSFGDRVPAFIARAAAIIDHRWE